MAELVVKEFKRYGHDMLRVVRRSDGTRVALHNRKSGETTFDDDRLAEQVRAVLAPYLATQPQRPPQKAAAPPSATTMPDVARNRPAQALKEQVRSLEPSRTKRLVAKVFNIETVTSSWEAGAAGERVVGKRLVALERQGWEVLHSVRLASGSDIDHLAIGPEGVFTINTKHHAGATIRVGTHVVWVNRSKLPYIRNSRHEAERAARLLTAACRMPVEVTPVLAFVGAQRIDYTDPAPDVIATDADSIARVLKQRPRILTPHSRDLIFAAARASETWLG